MAPRAGVAYTADRPPSSRHAVPGLASSSARSIQLCRWGLALVLAATMPVVSPRHALRRDFYFRTIGTEQGLAQNTVSAFLQDREGYLWIGTDSGLQQYDGYGFTTYSHASEDPSSLPEGPISSLAQDADGDLWIGTLGSGLVRHRPHANGFERVGAFTNV